MTIEEAKMAFEQLKAQGETDESILAVLYGMFAEDTIELDELESFVGVLGYELSEEFKNMSPEDQKTKGFVYSDQDTELEENMNTKEIKEISIVTNYYYKTAEGIDRGYDDLLRYSSKEISYKRKPHNAGCEDYHWSRKSNDKTFMLRYNYLCERVVEILKNADVTQEIQTQNRFNIRLNYKDGTHDDYPFENDFVSNNLIELSYFIFDAVPAHEYISCLVNLFSSEKITNDFIENVNKDNICAVMYTEENTKESSLTQIITTDLICHYLTPQVTLANKLTQSFVLNVLFDEFKLITGYSNTPTTIEYNNSNWVHLWISEGKHLLLRDDLYQTAGRFVIDKERHLEENWNRFISFREEELVESKRDSDINDDESLPSLDSATYNEEVKTFGTNYRALNHYVMDHTSDLCKTDENLVNAIRDSKGKQYVVYHDDKINAIKDGPTTNIIVSNKRSFEAAKAYKGKKVAVLNFANNHTVGGAPWSAGAQEESLCRTSTLYPCLQAMGGKYYIKHLTSYKLKKLTNLGNDDLIYTPGVVVFKTDESAPLLLDQSERFSLDIITAAAPEVNGEKSSILEGVLSSRIEKILQIAKKENVDVLILGAFGCGAFGNPPELVAKLFKEKLEKYSFDTVEFAVYCSTNSPDNNYNTFKKIILN